MASSLNDIHQPLLQSYPPPPTLTTKHDEQHDLHASNELERVLSDTDRPFLERLKPALWIESKLLFYLAAPAVIVYMINYVMSMSTQIFAGHLGNLELAAASLGNNGILIFSYGLLVRNVYQHYHIIW